MDAIGTLDDQLEPKPRRRIALHLRVSTKDEKQDADNQRLQFRQFCQTQGWEIAKGKSDRVQCRQMMQDASARKWVLLVFWALDRFTSCSLGTPGCL